MGASGISLNETDMHAVIDMETDVWINHPRSVRVEPHVWFCKDVMVMKGVTVGMGAVLAARAVVTSDVPRWSIAAGVPAHVIRRGIVWDRQAQPTPGLVERLHGLEAQISPFAGMSRA
jgi:acetyltransferase-like isoleucine patch superfamily enzyme